MKRFGVRLYIFLQGFFSLCVVWALFFLFIFGVYARTVEDVQKEIDTKKQELESTNSQILNLQEEIKSIQEQANEVAGKRNQISSKIAVNKKEIEIYEKRLIDLEETQELYLLERERRILSQDNIMKQSYISWKQGSVIKNVLGGGGEHGVSFLKVNVYHSAIAGEERASIEKLSEELTNIEAQMEEATNNRIEFEKKLEILNTEVELLQVELNGLDVKIRGNQNDIKNYRARIGSIQSEIDELTAEQKAIQEYEASLLKLGQADNGGTRLIESGDVYFQGVGRALYQGHGVGMSQFGALGAALKGWDYKKILKLYYPGTEIVKYKSRDISVSGYGSMGIEEYVSGAGEVPDYACEDLDLEFDHNNIWKCWPREAIKAQIVAFRSYGLYKTKGGTSICTTARCQVYKGGTNKSWAAEETELEVVAFEGEPISAFYSSDNHNGWGTANNDTVWSNFEGIGTPKPYLRAVNDSAIAYNYVYTNWKWRTNGYSWEEINAMFDWSISSSNVSDSYRDFLKKLKAEVGQVSSFEFVRDPSGRVKQIRVGGDKGNAMIAGWLFKSIWNIWIGNENPSGEKDFIYSLTYYKLVGN